MMKGKPDVSGKPPAAKQSGGKQPGAQGTVTEEKSVSPPAEPQQDLPARPSLNPLQVVASVFAAGLGVQSSSNRERDFKQGRAGVFIVAGLLFTLAFIGGIYLIVQLVLRNAGH
jgi:hypothetical protein